MATPLDPQDSYSGEFPNDFNNFGMEHQIEYQGPSTDMTTCSVLDTEDKSKETKPTTKAKRKTQFLDLPNELLLKIVQNIGSYLPSDKATLRSLSMVSKRLHPMCQENFLANISLPLHRVPELLAFLLQYPEYIPRITNLKVFMADASPLLHTRGFGSQLRDQCKTIILASNHPQKQWLEDLYSKSLDMSLAILTVLLLLTRNTLNEVNLESCLLEIAETRTFLSGRIEYKMVYRRIDYKTKDYFVSVTESFAPGLAEFVPPRRRNEAHGLTDFISLPGGWLCLL
ncbi:hypothetical protein K504DRAFT_456633 [Pleomassaria siparia CBS 279.74]|uniref:F-box domain-containing protein n=1 Tax=Pleomassaria siparia CBS 279.74 TaxID=1314801 RepID=A0A6G1KPK8_9PLEO|nr:hypothetical protein K504DRAFT_456633 [Pleomassaria siparia CBS 279.74]